MTTPIQNIIVLLLKVWKRLHQKVHSHDLKGRSESNQYTASLNIMLHCLFSRNATLSLRSLAFSPNGK